MRWLMVGSECPCGLIHFQILIISLLVARPSFVPPSFGSRGSGGGWWLRAWVGLVRAWASGPFSGGVGGVGFVRVPSGPSFVVRRRHQ